MYTNKEIKSFSRLYDILVNLKEEIEHIAIKDLSVPYKIENLVARVLVAIQIYEEKIPEEFKKTKLKFDVNKLEKDALYLQKNFIKG